MEQAITQTNEATSVSDGALLPLIGAIVLMLLWGAYTLSVSWEILAH